MLEHGIHGVKEVEDGRRVTGYGLQLVKLQSCSTGSAFRIIIHCLSGISLFPDLLGFCASGKLPRDFSTAHSMGCDPGVHVERARLETS